MRINEPSFWITILHNLILIKKFLLFKDLLLINDYPRATSLTLTFLNKLQSKLCWKFIFIWTFFFSSAYGLWRTLMVSICIIILLCFNPNRNGSNSRIVLQTPEFAPELVNPVKLTDKAIEGRSLNSEIVLKIWKLVHNYLVCNSVWIINSIISSTLISDGNPRPGNWMVKEVERRGWMNAIWPLIHGSECSSTKSRGAKIGKPSKSPNLP